MPHFGQRPGVDCRTSGCIGHVYTGPSGFVVGALLASEAGVPLTGGVWGFGVAGGGAVFASSDGADSGARGLDGSSAGGRSGGSEMHAVANARSSGVEMRKVGHQVIMSSSSRSLLTNRILLV